MAEGVRRWWAPVAALRPVHWVKNLLLLAPAIFGQISLTGALARDLSIGLLVMSMAASAGYLVNDVLDSGADRVHPVKRRRAVAAGTLLPRAALALATLLALGAVILAFLLLGAPIAGWVAGYLVVTLAYSIRLKRLPVIDLFTLIVLYLVRLRVGGDIAGIVISEWLWAFSFCFVATLALGKRLDELIAGQANALIAGRYYRPAHVRAFEVTSLLFAALTVAVPAGYIVFSQAALLNYRAPHWLWGGVVLLAIWLARILYRARGGRLAGDPVRFAVSDPLSLALAFGMTIALVAAI